MFIKQTFQEPCEHIKNLKINIFDSIISKLEKYSVISWWSVLLVEETGVHRENQRPAAS
jgi:hypothetical protein